MSTTYNVIGEGTNSGFHYRVVVKNFKTQAAADRYADKKNTPPTEGFYFVEVANA